MARAMHVVQPEPGGPHYGLRLDMPPPEHATDGGLSLGERLRGIEDGQREVLTVLRDLQIHGSIAAQQALTRVAEVNLEVKLIDTRVERIELAMAPWPAHRVDEEVRLFREVQDKMVTKDDLKERDEIQRNTNRWLIGTVIAIVALVIAVAGLIITHK